MNKIIFSFIECFYLIYMMIYFKTTMNFASKKSLFTNSFLYHPVDKAKEPRNMICPMGHYLAYIGSIFILLRLFFENSLNKKYLKLYHYPLMVILIMFTLINLNSFIYLLPLFMYEIFIYPNF